MFFKKAEIDDSLGRPRNGMFIAIPVELRSSVKDVSPSHWRIQAIIVKTEKSSILIINSYFPTDPRVSDFDMSELESTLNCINEVISNNQFGELIWCGDLNAEFSRRTKFTKHIDNFIS